MVQGRSLDEPHRNGIVREVLVVAGSEHYRVGWDNGHESLLYPGPDTRIIPAQVSREQPPAESEAAEGRPVTEEAPEPRQPRLEDPSETIMSAPVATVDAHDSLRVTAVTLADAEVGALVVMSGSSPLGVISERDVVHALAAGGDPDEVAAANVISATTVWASPSDTIRQVAELMRDAGVRHIPLSVQGAVVGMVSVRDVHRILLASE